MNFSTNFSQTQKTILQALHYYDTYRWNKVGCSFNEWSFLSEVLSIELLMEDIKTVVLNCFVSENRERYFLIKFWRFWPDRIPTQRQMKIVVPSNVALK